MTREALLDTSFLVAALDERDVLHQRAMELNTRLVAGSVEYIVTDLVLIEATNVFGRRANERANPKSAAIALETALRWIGSGAVENIGPAIPSLLPAACERVRADPLKLNLIDALLVEFILSSGIGAIVSFDKDFDGIPGISRLS